MTPRPTEPPSFARILITPIIVVAAGYLIGGMYGLAVGAFIGIVYVLVASDRAKRTARPSSSTAELARLADLRDRGVLTQAEFEEQKARILLTLSQPPINQQHQPRDDLL